jgi:hypothetical protein
MLKESKASSDDFENNRSKTDRSWQAVLSYLCKLDSCTSSFVMEESLKNLILNL